MEEHRHHETTDVSVGPVVKFIIGLLVLLAFALGLVYAVARYFRTHQPSPAVALSPVETAPLEPPPPRLQVSPAQDLRALRAAEDAVLNSYGWVDRNAGIVRIPIDRAMDLFVQREGKR